MEQDDEEVKYLHVSIKMPDEDGSKRPGASGQGQKRRVSESSSSGISPPSRRKPSVKDDEKGSEVSSRKRDSKFVPSEGKIEEDDIKLAGPYEVIYEGAPDQLNDFMKYRFTMYWWALFYNTLTCCACNIWEALVSCFVTLGFICRCCWPCYPKADKISDERVTEIFTKIYPWNSVRQFRGHTRDDFVVDTTAVEGVMTVYGEHLVGGKAYWKGGRLEKIKCVQRNYYPGDYLYEAAKTHFLQGACYLFLLVVHPRLHFPQSQVFFHIRTFFKNKNAAVFKLLAIHSRFAETLDQLVLFSPGSVVEGSGSKTCSCCWDVQPFNKLQAERNLICLGWKRDYIFGMPQELVDLGFAPAFQAIVELVEEVWNHDVQRFPQMEEEAIGLMASLREYLGDDIGNDFVTFWADFIFKVSIDHSMSHHLYSEVMNRSIPMDIRYSPFYRRDYAPSIRVRPMSHVKQSYYKVFFFSLVE
eukprot:TRINITY_DN5986_c0_g1_i2.p1 TRINITY_DN5986_c0_g1~~TRINITY_DN5986_c0_g1_i2.p1  ORF type:complete len:522 (-),score=86.40 TRINITY_DN5986_c0_g1_i2:235-1647(-)